MDKRAPPDGVAVVELKKGLMALADIARRSLVAWCVAGTEKERLLHDGVRIPPDKVDEVDQLLSESGSADVAASPAIVK